MAEEHKLSPPPRPANQEPDPPYVYHEFPKMLYGPLHQTKEGRVPQTKVVADEKEQRALGSGWFETPSEAEEAGTKKAQSAKK